MPVRSENSSEFLLPAFTPEDVRQFVYCPRIIYHRYVLRLKRVRTRKMAKGTDDHETWKRKQIRRGEDTDRYFGIYLSKPDIGMFGLLDAIDFDGVNASPIELKTGKAPTTQVFDHHRAQILAQCYLVESSLKAQVSDGAVYYQRNDSEIRIPYSAEDREFVASILGQMREIVISENLPERTQHSAKCVDCEFAPFCV